MTKIERIRQLEKRVIELENQLRKEELVKANPLNPFSEAKMISIFGRIRAIERYLGIHISLKEKAAEIVVEQRALPSAKKAKAGKK